MFKVLELSGLFVCLGGLVKTSKPEGTEEIAGLWFTRAISTQAIQILSISFFSFSIHS